MGKDNWFANKNLAIDDAIKAFNEWASDAPVVFEMEARNSLSHCMISIMKKED